MGEKLRTAHFCEFTGDLSIDLMLEGFAAINSNKKRIGIMGGTFNPIHLGHIHMSIKAHDEFNLDRVLFIPTGSPPHKDNKEIAGDYHRLAMIELVLDEAYMRCLDIEIKRKGTTYTIDTIVELEKRFNEEYEFYYIIGSDMLFMLDSWKNFISVLDKTNFIVFLRDQDDSLAVKNSIEFYNSLDKKKIYLSSEHGLLVSSTKARFHIRNNLNLQDLLDERVIKYIKENNIYR